MKGDIDPRLMAQIEEAGDEGEVEAMILLADEAETARAPDERGAGGRLIDRVTEQLKQPPVEVRFMPRLGALFVKGSGKLVRQLLEQDEVISASANEAEITTSLADLGAQPLEKKTAR